MEKTHVRCKITEGKVGHKFGEFAATRKRNPHGKFSSKKSFSTVAHLSMKSIVMPKKLTWPLSMIGSLSVGVFQISGRRSAIKDATLYTEGMILTYILTRTKEKDVYAAEAVPQVTARHLLCQPQNHDEQIHRDFQDEKRNVLSHEEMFQRFQSHL